jgi:gas vesicle protein
MMARDSDGGGFGWGFVIGGVIGLAAGAYLATGPGREQVEGLRQRTVELTGGSGEELKARARAAAARAGEAMRDPDHPMRKAIQEGVEAARRRKQELEAEAARAPGGAAHTQTAAGDGREGA